MEVLLCKDVAKLGKAGDVVRVKEGYARNFLLPLKLACLASASNVKRVELEKSKRAAEHAAKKKEAEVLADKLGKVSCTVTVEVNDLEKMYGSVSETEIAQAIEVEGVTIDKKMILLDSPITELGIFDVNIKLHPEVIAKVKVWVAKK